MNKWNVWNRQIINEFRANQGKVGGTFEDLPLLLLYTTGAKSGLLRVNPLTYLADDERYIVVASKMGAPTNPDWYHNIVANPEISAEVDTEQFPALATVAMESERTQLYEKMEAKFAWNAEYRSKTARSIPVVILTRKL